MVPQMAASVLLLSVCKAFPVFSFLNTIHFTRDEQLNIRQNTPQNLLPDLDYSVVLLDIVVDRAAALQVTQTGEATWYARETSSARI